MKKKRISDRHCIYTTSSCMPALEVFLALTSAYKLGATDLPIRLVSNSSKSLSIAV